MSEENTHRQSVDNKMLAVLDSVAEYRRLRDECGASFRQAFFELARAKRSAGYQWISPDLYNANPKAIATVSITGSTDDDGDGDGDCGDGMEISGVHRREADTHSCSETGSTTSNSNASSREADKDEELEDEKPRRRKASDDPLLWFGMLVPPPLKDAQKGFVASLDTLVRLAQLHHTIRCEQKELQHEMEATGV
ncbi:hypothetical protein IW140_000393 [Coemansia sp. RSA 1813]|nr:hypothetical protein EV178_000648 [Coemansia sp. RSA 1646]KAJ1773266.1 hypothetical protein LPJ74_000776 [Coemansia sp. RSA 1843]KAJ2092733.1 hypothetical protein IW138_000827 [Coemansia sp. RSA 986]KAJ2217768.1 hypothetical protein EV179_000254 [Coemansia sp. RSA 487]KAJ2572995.1 hypothetical protein IW140_000393 [Coemansia sp. RSA 1813]